MIKFTAKSIAGSGRGTSLGCPTVNLDTSDVPEDLEEGIYACHAIIDGHMYHAVMHYGPRPTFNDTRSCEVHLLEDIQSNSFPESVIVRIYGRIRDVENFESVEDLKERVKEDIKEAYAILCNHVKKD